MGALRRRDLARVFGRSLWLQASWSFEGMQSVGFAYAVEPALLRLGGPQAVVEGRVRHLEFFNTHPYLAAAILGCVVKLEEQGQPEAARKVKGVLMGPCGALGDTLYWGAVKPVLLLAAVAAALQGVLWAPWLFLGLFGAANLGGRLFFFVEGYREGIGIVQKLGELNLLTLTRRLKGACALLLGLVVTGSATGWPSSTGWAPLAVGAAAAAGAAVGLAWAYRRGFRPVWTVYLTAALAAGILAWK
ncbi:MAG: PTS system mannose/fructose/sorbose family transporter subunit IID [Deltaproteobacteria bacterium]|nr:PTS system mannose/fructose/sorbose family transporter subunit IID [Deltaproteobacteria bacterium]